MLANAIICFTACSDDDDDTAPAAGGGTGGGGNNAAEMMSVKIDGTSKTFDSVFGANVFGTITLIGSDNTASGYPQITISIHLGQVIGPTTLETRVARGVQVDHRLAHREVVEDKIND